MFVFFFCFFIVFFFFFKQKTAYEIYQCDWSSDVCSSDLRVLDDGAARKMRDTENLCRRWATLAPRDLAAHTRPVRYDHGQLILETDSPSWAARLRYQHGTWLAQLRQTSEFSELRQIQFRVHPRGD